MVLDQRKGHKLKEVKKDFLKAISKFNKQKGLKGWIYIHNIIVYYYEW